jgi:hypothetical protein
MNTAVEIIPKVGRFVETFTIASMLAISSLEKWYGHVDAASMRYKSLRM